MELKDLRPAEGSTKNRSAWAAAPLPAPVRPPVAA